MQHHASHTKAPHPLNALPSSTLPQPLNLPPQFAPPPPAHHATDTPPPFHSANHTRVSTPLMSTPLILVPDTQHTHHTTCVAAPLLHLSLVHAIQDPGVQMPLMCYAGVDADVLVRAMSQQELRFQQVWAQGACLRRVKCDVWGEKRCAAWVRLDRRGGVDRA